MRPSRTATARRLPGTTARGFAVRPARVTGVGDVAGTDPGEVSRGPQISVATGGGQYARLCVSYPP